VLQLLVMAWLLLVLVSGCVPLLLPPLLSLG
jgi:hypothetical protein